MSQVNMVKCLLGMFIVFALVIPLAHAQSVIDCPRSGVPVTIDGKWNGNEWDDAVEISLEPWAGSRSGVAFLRAKYDGAYFYAIVDVTSTPMATTDDGASITFDTKNDAGDKARPDDYIFVEYFNGQPSMGQGTGSGFEWATSLPKGVLASASIGTSPHSAGYHPIYEFRIPLSLFPETSTVRFAVAVWWNSEMQNAEVLLTWPRNYLSDVPVSWGTMNFPTPIPEFAHTVVLVVLTFCAAALVTRDQSKKRVFS